MTTPYPKSTHAFLEQGTWWRNVRGEWVPVAEMVIEYRFNCARLLMNRAARYALAVELEELRLISMFGAPDDIDEPSIHYPDSWMRNRPLYRALAHDLPTTERGAAKLLERARHYSTCPMRLRRRLRPENAACACPPKEEAA